MQNVLEIVLLGESAARKITHSLTLVSWSRLLIKLQIFFVTFNSYSKCTETIEGTPTQSNLDSQAVTVAGEQ